MQLFDTPGHLLRRCQQRSQDLFRKELGAFGLTQQQTAVLITLANCSGVSIQDLADLSGSDRNTLSAVTGRLISRGLIARRRSRRDARAYELRITAAGLQLLRSMEPGIARVQQQILAPLPAAEREQFVAMIRRIAAIDTGG